MQQCNVFHPRVAHKLSSDPSQSIARPCDAAEDTKPASALFSSAFQGFARSCSPRSAGRKFSSLPFFSSCEPSWQVSIKCRLCVLTHQCEYKEHAVPQEGESEDKGIQQQQRSDGGDQIASHPILARSSWQSSDFCSHCSETLVSDLLSENFPHEASASRLERNDLDGDQHGKYS